MPRTTCEAVERSTAPIELLAQENVASLARFSDVLLWDMTGRKTKNDCWGFSMRSMPRGCIGRCQRSEVGRDWKSLELAGL